MDDKTVLLEERKEITTFLLDEGDITETVDVLPTGSVKAYDYSGEKIHAEDVVTISSKSEIGKIHVRRYCENNDDCLIFGIAVNSPLTMTGGKRKTAILILGHIFRFKLASRITNINVKDRIALTPDGAVVSDDGIYFAMHPVKDSDEYNFIEVFIPYNLSACSSSFTCGTYWQTTSDESFSDIKEGLSENMINIYNSVDVGWASDNDGEFYIKAKPRFFEDPIFVGGLVKKESDVFYNDPMKIKYTFKIENGLTGMMGFGFCFKENGTYGIYAGITSNNPTGMIIKSNVMDIYSNKDSQVTLSAGTVYKVEMINKAEDASYVIKYYSENDELLSTVNVNKSYLEKLKDYGLDLTEPIYFGIVIGTQTSGDYIKKFSIGDVEITTPIRN